MRRGDFYFELPPEAIAQYPLPERGASRLLVLDGTTGQFVDRWFRDLPSLLRPGDLLVVNDTRVIPARLYARKESGGRVEILIERLLGTHDALAQLRASKPVRPGSVLRVAADTHLQVGARHAGFVAVRAQEAPFATVLERYGHTPLPPYIQRADEPSDAERYQTVYARQPGAVAAPTAGLHFDTALLSRLEAQGIARASLTLHIGAGTFQPVRAAQIEEHTMHAEWLEVSAALCAQVAETQARGGRVVAVGTTVVRALETAAAGGRLCPFQGDTRLFIYPGYRFRVVDALLTNFHLPESTLLMLVAAFAGHAPVMAAYRHAVAQGYRFFSYGDAMFLTRAPDPGATGCASE